MILREIHDLSTIRKVDAFGTAYRGRYLLLLLWSNSWLEICNPLPALSLHMREAKSPCIRGRIVDEIDFSTKFHIESCVRVSDVEDA
ncbi:hypothetical protein CR513_15981, partial [Mucuna pruriens]